MDCSLRGSSVHGILQARLLERVVLPFSRGSSQPRDTPGLLHCRQILYQEEDYQQVKDEDVLTSK